MSAKLAIHSQCCKKSVQTVHFSSLSRALVPAHITADFALRSLHVLHFWMATCLVINTFHDVVLFKCPTLFLHLLAFSMFSPMSDQTIPRWRKNYPPMEKKLSPDGEKIIPWSRFSASGENLSRSLGLTIPQCRQKCKQSDGKYLLPARRNSLYISKKSSCSDTMQENARQK